jgi:hypothetical protein
MVGDGDAVSIATEIVKNVLGCRNVARSRSQPEAPGRREQIRVVSLGTDHTRTRCDTESKHLLRKMRIEETRLAHPEAVVSARERARRAAA